MAGYVSYLRDMTLEAERDYSAHAPDSPIKVEVVIHSGMVPLRSPTFTCADAWATLYRTKDPNRKQSLTGNETSAYHSRNPPL